MTDGFRYVEIGCRDLSRSIDFYTGLLDLTVAEPAPTEFAPVAGQQVAWLDAGPAMLKLVETGPDGALGGWINDDLQCGLRHVGFAVGSVDERAAVLRDGGATFTVEPTDAVGVARLAFFTDPDGTLLELIEGSVDYDETFAPDIAQRQAAEAPAAGAAPRLDHVAVTVADSDATLAFYRDALGFTPVGTLAHRDDPRGFRIHWLHAGDGVIEVFSFDVETTASPWMPDTEQLGIRGVGLEVADVGAVTGRLTAAGAVTPAPPGVPTTGVPAPEASGDGALVTDPDGVPLQVVPRA